MSLNCSFLNSFYVQAFFVSGTHKLLLHISSSQTGFKYSGNFTHGTSWKWEASTCLEVYETRMQINDEVYKSDAPVIGSVCYERKVCQHG